MTRSITRLTLGVGLPYLLALVAIAFWPTPVDSGMSVALDRAIAWLDRRGLGAIDYGVIESTANVALFVPLGLLAALHLRARWSWVAVLLGALISAAIETGQLLLLPARFASPHDVLMNTTGAAVGAALGVLLRWWIARRERRRRAEWDLALAHIPLRDSSGVLGDR